MQFTTICFVCLLFFLSFFSVVMCYIGNHTTHFKSCANDTKKFMSLSPRANRPSLFYFNCDCDIVTKIVAFEDEDQLDIHLSIADPEIFQDPHQIQISMGEAFSSFVMNWFEFLPPATKL